MSGVKIYAFADEASSKIDGQIAALRRNALQGLEIRNVDGTNVSDIDLNKAREVREKLDAAGLVTWSVGSPIGKINITDDFSSHLDKFKHSLEIASVLGAKNIRLFSFYIPEGVSHRDCKGEVIDRLGCLAQAAHGSGINLCHENEKGIYGDTADRCLELFEAGIDLMGIFDPANFVQCGEDTLDAWAKLKKYIRYMHIKDARADGLIVPAGQGAGNIKQIAAEFIKNGGRDFTLEPHLTVFDGLAALEREGEQSNISDLAFTDSNTAFDTACAAFKSLIQ